MMTILWVWLYFASCAFMAMRVNKKSMAMSLTISIFWFYTAPMFLFMRIYGD